MRRPCVLPWDLAASASMSAPSVLRCVWRSPSLPGRWRHILPPAFQTTRTFELDAGRGSRCYVARAPWRDLRESLMVSHGCALSSARRIAGLAGTRLAGRAARPVQLCVDDDAARPTSAPKAKDGRHSLCCLDHVRRPRATTAQLRNDDVPSARDTRSTQRGSRRGRGSRTPSAEGRSEA